MKSLFSQGRLFEVGIRTNVVTLTGANYHGLGMRFLQELDPLAVHLASEGFKSAGHARCARALSNRKTRANNSAMRRTLEEYLISFTRAMALPRTKPRASPAPVWMRRQLGMCLLIHLALLLTIGTTTSADAKSGVHPPSSNGLVRDDQRLHPPPRTVSSPSFVGVIANEP